MKVNYLYLNMLVNGKETANKTATKF